MSAAQSRVVADRYRLVEPLGQGGMGRVWMARDELLHRDVAIKELIPPPGLTDDERQEMRERAMREARAIARLSHPNVVRIFDILRTEGEPWIVMEYVRSRSLQEVLAQDGPLPARRVAEIGLGMLAALRAAHRSGVVHRDVKPGNVLLGDDGRVVLTDFGLATVPGDPVVTRTGLVLGSPAYISPERAHDGTAGPAADMWSLGATLYAAVEGQSPYARPSAIATLAALATEPPAPPRRAGPLKPVLLGLLRKDPAERIMAKEAERLLMRAAGRRTRPGVPLLPGARRPFAEGYLPSPRITPGTPPVVAAVAPVPPPRRPKPEPERPADQVHPAKDARADAPAVDAPAGETPAAEAPAADAPATGAGGESTPESGKPGTAGPDQLATTLKEQAGSAAGGVEPAEPTTEQEGGAEPEPATLAEPAPPVEQATAVDMEPVAEPAPQVDAPEPGSAGVAGPSPAPAPTAGRTPAPGQAARRTPATASAAVTAIEPAVRDTPGGRPAPADRARAMSSALADRARSMPARTRAVIAGVVAVIALAVLLIVVLSGQDGDGDPKSGGAPAAPTQGPGSTSAPTAAPTQNTPSPEAEPTGAAVVPPAGWRRYRGPGGFSVVVPAGWQVSRDDSRVEFREQGGEYRVLIIDQSDSPKADPVKDWTQQEAQRAHLKRNYHRIHIQKVDYFLAAADWEYTYDLAAPLHAINRGFVTGPHQAHAILWITPERTWKANLDEFDLITRSFVPNPE